MTLGPLSPRVRVATFYELTDILLCLASEECFRIRSERCDIYSPLHAMAKHSRGQPEMLKGFAGHPNPVVWSASESESIDLGVARRFKKLAKFFEGPVRQMEVTVALREADGTKDFNLIVAQAVIYRRTPECTCGCH